MGFFSIFRKSKSVSVIPLNGVIAPNMGRRKGLNLNEIDKNIEQAFSVKNLKAVALQINSPGGSPVQSEMIANRIRELSDKNNVPVLAFVEDVAASGGYWLACAADEIIASKASIIGSIGVVSSGFGFNKAIEKIGIENHKNFLTKLGIFEKTSVLIELVFHILNLFLQYLNVQQFFRWSIYLKFDQFDQLNQT